MKRTVVVIAVLGLIGMWQAASAAPMGGTRGTTPVFRPVFTDNQVVPAGCGCQGGYAADDCGCGGDCGCGCDQGCGSSGHSQVFQRGGCGACGGCGCNECCGGNDCCAPCCDSCCCEPWIRLRAEALPMTRTRGEENVSFDGLINNSQFDFNFEIGIRAAAEFKVGCDSSVEVVYTGLQEWEDQVLFNDNLGTTAQADYSSEFHSGEINFWCPVKLKSCRVRGSLLFGVRYLSLNEDFNFQRALALVPTASIAIETNNHIVAPQVGWMLGGDVGHNFSLRWDGKAGAGPNLVSRTTTIPTPLELEQEVTDIAFVGDTTLIASYQLGCGVSVYAGYYLLWVDGLALAPQQSFTDLNQIDHNGFLFFQGGVAGVEATW